MRFNQVFVEEKVKDSPHTQSFIDRLSGKHEIKIIDKIENVFQKVKKPYLQKRDNLNLFIGEKKGVLVKEAPSAYGKKGEPHYYFVNNYNCPYECQYCYLQGFFNSPDLVHFVNYEDVVSEMGNVLNQHPNENVWFHGGEFSDSLALSHLNDELNHYFKFFYKNESAILELRTKSSNIKKLKELDPSPNIIVSYTLSPQEQAKNFDLKTASLSARLRSIKELQNMGYRTALHFDPIIYNQNFESNFDDLINQMKNVIDLSLIEYISLGVVRFTKDVYKEAKNNYPESQMWALDFKKSFDGKVRLMRPLRFYIFKSVSSKLIKANISPDKIYYCMENE